MPMTQQQNAPHPALRLRHTLRGHISIVYRMALSPDGHPRPKWQGAPVANRYLGQGHARRPNWYY